MDTVASDSPYSFITFNEWLWSWPFGPFTLHRAVWCVVFLCFFLYFSLSHHFSEWLFLSLYLFASDSSPKLKFWFSFLHWTISIILTHSQDYAVKWLSRMFELILRYSGLPCSTMSQHTKWRALICHVSRLLWGYIIQILHWRHNSALCILCHVYTKAIHQTTNVAGLVMSLWGTIPPPHTSMAILFFGMCHSRTYRLIAQSNTHYIPGILVYPTPPVLDWVGGVFACLTCACGGISWAGRSPLMSSSIGSEVAVSLRCGELSTL